MSVHTDLSGLLAVNSEPGTLELTFRVVFALIVGSAVGLERQWRAGLAGLRTNALVSTGAGLFVVMGAYAFGEGSSADPTRVAAQVVSGIGFLGAGVILREGLNIRGLNTAATLWCSAALGCLAGMGMYFVATVGTFVIIAANVLLRWLGKSVSRRSRRSLSNTPDETEYVFEVVTTEKSEPRVRALLLQTLNRPEYKLLAVSASHKKNNSTVSLQASLQSALEDAGPLERAVSRMTLDPKVKRARWWVNDDDNEDEY